MNKAELILKVILASQATIVDTYKALIVEGSETDFQRVLELKVRTPNLHFVNIVGLT